VEDNSRKSGDFDRIMTEPKRARAKVAYSALAGGIDVGCYSIRKRVLFYRAHSSGI
jgi:hypothetical protein